MKKILISAISFLLVVSLLSILIYGEENKYSVPDIYSEYMEEDINNYFLPQAYDLIAIRSSKKEVEYDYETCVVKNEEGRIIIPPMVSAANTVYGNELKYDEIPMYFQETYNFVYNSFDFNQSVTEERRLTPEMLRTLCLGNESAVRSFVAPWTLYNAKTGELYTFPELMAMSEADLEALDFKTPDFAKFIANVKGELEARGWWKEEYQAKYDILYAHRDDYKNSLDESESFVIDGVEYNFSTMYYEFDVPKFKIHNNITCVNIFADEFKTVFKNANENIKLKYSDMFEAIGFAYSTNGTTEYYAPAYQMHFDDLVLKSLTSITEKEKTEIIENQMNKPYSQLPLFFVLNNYDVTKEEMRTAITEFNYMVSAPWAVFGDTYIEALLETDDLWTALEMVTTDVGIVLSEENCMVVQFVLQGPAEIVLQKCYPYISNIDKIIEQISIKYRNHEECEAAISYLESLKEPPKTGDNSVLYVIIATASLTAMSALVFRRKRKVTE